MEGKRNNKIKSGFLPQEHLIFHRPQFSLVQFSCSVVSDSLWPHESQHARPPCPSPTPGVHPNSCPSSRWCHPAISSSVVPFSSTPPIPPSIRVFSNESTLARILKVHGERDLIRLLQVCLNVGVPRKCNRNLWQCIWPVNSVCELETEGESGPGVTPGPSEAATGGRATRDHRPFSFYSTACSLSPLTFVHHKRSIY